MELFVPVLLRDSSDFFAKTHRARESKREPFGQAKRKEVDWLAVALTR